MVSHASAISAASVSLRCSAKLSRADDASTSISALCRLLDSDTLMPSGADALSSSSDASSSRPSNDNSWPNGRVSWRVIQE